MTLTLRLTVATFPLEGCFKKKGGTQAPGKTPFVGTVNHLVGTSNLATACFVTWAKSLRASDQAVSKSCPPPFRVALTRYLDEHGIWVASAISAIFTPGNAHSRLACDVWTNWRNGILTRAHMCVCVWLKLNKYGVRRFKSLIPYTKVPCWVQSIARW